MRLTLEMDLDNAAFWTEDADPVLVPEAIVAELTGVGIEIEAGSTGGKIMDVNGNSVGSWNVFEP